MIKNVNVYEENIKEVLKENEFMELKNQKILITGANGLIGSAIIDVLNYLNIYENYNMKIIAMVRNENKVLQRLKEYKNVKIIGQDVIEKIKFDEDVDYIIHTASNSHPQLFSNNPVDTMLGNFLGINNILKFASTHNCKKVEYISSGEVYGQGTEEIEMFEENYSGKINSMNPRSCYPISKLASETLCASYSSQYGIQTVVARPCHIYGPTQTNSDSRVIAQFIRNTLNGENIVMKSEGKQIRSYCYVLDCVTAILMILTKGKEGNAYNIANKQSIISIRQMAEMIARKSNLKVEYELPTKLEEKGYNPVTKSVLDESKLEKLGWKPCYTFEEGIEQTLKIMV